MPDGEFGTYIIIVIIIVLLLVVVVVVVVVAVMFLKLIVGNKFLETFYSFCFACLFARLRSFFLKASVCLSVCLSICLSTSVSCFLLFFRKFGIELVVGKFSQLNLSLFFFLKL